MSYSRFAKGDFNERGPKENKKAVVKSNKKCIVFNTPMPCYALPWIDDK